MKRIQPIILVSIVLCISFSFRAQQKMIVSFNDKPTSKAVLFSEDALNRREINESEVDFFDLQIEANYLQNIQSIGKVINFSRWLNAVVLETELSAQEIMNRFSFVSAVKLVSTDRKSTIKKDLNQEKSINYGLAINQIEQIGIDCLHEQGFTGQGIKLAVIDAGFENMESIGFFDSLYVQNRVFDTYDFVNGTNVYSYSGHGTAVSSCIVGQKFGADEYAGTGKDVTLALYVAEDVGSETEIEEFNVVAALERADSAGVRVVNISLGYTDFDDSVSSHTFQDMDGVTTIAAIGVNVAFSKGIIVVMSAGNSGPDHISTPCDALHGFCVGAVDEAGNIASFSSVGPSFDLRVKPDVVARGLQPWLIQSNGDLSQASGTSFSSPIMAGAVACLIQAHPQSSALNVMQAVRMSANQFSSPDAYLGYGIPDFCEASTILASLGNNELTSLLDIQIYPNPANEFLIIQGLENAIHYFKLLDVLGNELKINSSSPTNGANELSLSHISSGTYFLKIINKENGQQITKKVVVQK